jgi:hypothetical protein
MTHVGRTIPPKYGIPNRHLIWGLVLLGFVAAIILFLFNPAQTGFYPICFFYHSTGLLCPGCGSLRAIHQLLHGHVAAAFEYNALLIVSLPVLSWVALRLLLSRKPMRMHPLILWSAVGVLVLFGILRNVL